MFSQLALKANRAIFSERLRARRRDEPSDARSVARALQQLPSSEEPSSEEEPSS
jgi:hypothetical protein